MNLFIYSYYCCYLFEYDNAEKIYLIFNNDREDTLIRIRKISWILWVLAGYVLLPACAQKSDVNARHLPKTVAGFTPKGWKLYGAVKQFTPENLYEHINGRAEFYIAYNVTGLTFANFMQTDLNGPFIDLFIYDMTTPTNAFGVFSAERSPEGTPIHLGREAYRQGANYYIWKGRYYITVIASETSTELETIGHALAEKASHAVTDSGEKVWGLSVMPEKDMIPGTLKYVKNDVMGLDFLKNTCMAQYRKYDTDIKHFVSQNESEQAAQTVVNQYADFAKQYGKGIETKSAEGVDLIICDMEDYVDVIFQKNNWVAGVLSVKDKDTAFKAAIEWFHQLP